jgi:hypothetical protein
MSIYPFPRKKFLKFNPSPNQRPSGRKKMLIEVADTHTKHIVRCFWSWYKWCAVEAFSALVDEVHVGVLRRRGCLKEQMYRLSGDTNEMAG